MNNIFEYRGYKGTVQYSLEDRHFFGRVVNINGAVMYEGDTPEELEDGFKTTIDDYLERNKCEMKKEYKGSFNVRIGSELHEKLDVYAKSNQTTINRVVKDSLVAYLNE